jgi:hypothetical protein
MSTTEVAATRARRPRPLKEDLLEDLRHAAPMPVARPLLDQAAPAEPPDSTAGPEALAVELRLTPRRWSALSVQKLPVGKGLVVTAGPLHLHFRVLGR